MVSIYPCPVELFITIFMHLKLELLTQFPASNDKKIPINENQTYPKLIGLENLKSLYIN